MPTADEPRLTLRISERLHGALADRAKAEGLKPGTWVRRTLERELGLENYPKAQVASPRQPPGEESTAGSTSRPAAVPRQCEQCGRGIGSSTLRRCSCGGRIVPPV